MLHQLAAWRAEYKHRLEQKEQELAAAQLALATESMKMAEVQQQLQNRIKLSDTQRILFADKMRASDALVQHQKQQIAELLHSNETLNGKLSSQQQEYSEKLDTATSRILELESVLSIARIEADARLTESTRMSASLMAEQARFKDMLADFCSTVAEDTAGAASYHSALSAMSSSRNKLEASIFDLLRLSGTSSLLSQETEDLFNTINTLNSTIKAVKAKSRARTKKLTDLCSSKDEQHKAIKAELAETVWKLANADSDLFNVREALAASETESKRQREELQAAQLLLVICQQQLDISTSRLAESKRESDQLISLGESELQSMRRHVQALQDRERTCCEEAVILHHRLEESAAATVQLEQLLKAAREAEFDANQRHHEHEANLQGQLKQLACELEAASSAAKSKALNLKSTTFKVTELEKIIAELRAEISAQQSASTAQQVAWQAQLNDSEEKRRAVAVELANALHALEVAQRESRWNYEELQTAQLKLVACHQQLQEANSSKLTYEQQLQQAADDLHSSRKQLQAMQSKLYENEQAIQVAADQLQYREGVSNLRIEELQNQLVLAEQKCADQVKEYNRKSDEIEALQTACKSQETKLWDMEMAVQQLTKKLEDVTARCAAGIQEIKAMQGRLLAAQQQNEELELRVKDGSMRCSMLVADNDDLRKQKEEQEANLQGQLKQLACELEAASSAAKSKALNLKSTTFKVTELEKIIAELRAEISSQQSASTVQMTEYESSSAAIKNELEQAKEEVSKFEQELAAAKTLCEVKHESLRISQLRAATCEQQVEVTAKQLLESKQKYEHMLVHMEDEIQSVRRQVQQAKGAEDELQAQTSVYQRNLADSKLAFDELERKFMTAEKEWALQRAEWVNNTNAAHQLREDEQSRAQAALQQLSTKHELALIELQSLQAACKSQETKLWDMEMAVQQLTKKLEDVTARFAAGIQEIKAMQGRLLAAQQQNEELELRVKDGSMRCSMLVADNDDLRKQRAEVETAMAMLSKQSDGKLTEANELLQSMSLSIKSMSMEKTEHEKVVGTLQKRLDRKEAELMTSLTKLRGEKDEVKHMLLKITWKCTFLCDHVETALMMTAEPGNQLQTPRRGGGSPLRTPISPRADVLEVDSLVNRLDGILGAVDDLRQAHARVVADGSRSADDLQHARDEVERLRASMGQHGAQVLRDRKELDALRVTVEEQTRSLDDARTQGERQKALAVSTAQQLADAKKDLEHAESIVLKQKQALDSANDVMKKQRYELDELAAKLQHAEAKVKQLNAIVSQLRAETGRLEAEVAEYQQALTSVMARFQTEFGSLQSQLADLQTYTP